MSEVTRSELEEAAALFHSIAERAGTISLALKTHKLPIHWSETSGDVSRDIKSMMLDIVLDVVKAKPLLDRIPPDQLPQ